MIIEEVVARHRKESARTIHTPEWREAHEDRGALLREVERLRAQLNAQCPECGSIVGTKPVPVEREQARCTKCHSKIRYTVQDGRTSCWCGHTKVVV